MKQDKEQAANFKNRNFQRPNSDNSDINDPANAGDNPKNTKDKPSPNRGSMPLPDDAIDRGDKSKSNEAKKEVEKDVRPPKNADNQNK